MKKIIIDTNFLMIPFQFGVDIFSEFERICHFNYKLLFFRQSIKELEGIIKNQRGKDKRAAKFALKLIKIKSMHIIKSDKSEEAHVDLLILGSLDKDTIVATQDIALKREVIKKGSHVIILRQKKYLYLQN